MGEDKKDPLGAARDLLSDFLASFGQIRQQFGTFSALVISLTVATVVIWWNWDDIVKRPGVQQLLAYVFGPSIDEGLLAGIDQRLYDRIKLVQRGSTDNERCISWPKGTSVQIFDRGWMVYNPESRLIYVIEELQDGGPRKIDNISWASFEDTSIDPNNHYATRCSGLDENLDKLLEWGFRKLYCESSKARQMLGLPKSRGLPTWTQYQKSDAGVLLAGIPVTEPQAESGLFLQMKAIFLEIRGNNAVVGSGEAVTYSMNDIGGNIRCMALWRPAALDPYAYPDPLASWHKKDSISCKKYIDPADYIRGGKQCLIAISVK